VNAPSQQKLFFQVHTGARVVTEMKAGLESLIETYEADARLKERRDKRWRRPVGD
jgi:hypothetical protein